MKKWLISRRETMQKWGVGVKKDFYTKEFIPLKVLFFFMVGGMTTLFPFLTIQARSLGISGEELGLIYSLLPIIGICAPSFAGILADKIGNFKLFLSISVLCSGLAALLFIAIPPGRIDHDLQEFIPLTLRCEIGGHNVVQLNSPANCDIKNKSSGRAYISVCEFKCPIEIPSLRRAGDIIDEWCQNTDDCELPYNVQGPRGVAYEIANNFSTFDNQYIMNNYSVELTVQDKLLSETPLRDAGEEGSPGLRVEQTFCPNIIEEPATTSATLRGKEIGSCWLECQGRTKSEELCTNTKYTEILSPTVTILSYIIVRLINGVTLATSFTLFEGAVVAILKEKKGDLGLQRMFGNVGMIVLTPISGKLIDFFSTLNNKEDYTPAFFFYCGIKFVCAVVLLFINLEFKQPSNSVIKDFKELLVLPKVSAFILFTVAMGTCYGFVETFLFWLLEDLGAGKSLMGITVTVGASFGIPLLMMSSFFIKKLGHVNTLSLCSMIYIIRLIGYSLIQNPWLAMPFEALEAFTNALMTVTSMSYAGALSQPSTVASLQGLYTGTYHGVGRGVGSLAGGIMIKRIGTRGSFQVLAGVCGFAGVLYYLINRFYFSKVKEDGDKDSGNVDEERQENQSMEDRKSGTDDFSVDGRTHHQSSHGYENGSDDQAYDHDEGVPHNYNTFDNKGYGRDE